MPQELAEECSKQKKWTKVGKRLVCSIICQKACAIGAELDFILGVP